MVGPDLAVRVAANYRQMRSAGVTMNKISDLFIGTFCIANNHVLLHCDGDFAPMQRLCGLRCLE